MRIMLIRLIVIGLAFLLFACSAPPPGPAKETLRVGILPDEGEKALTERYTPLLEFLSRETGLLFELFVPDSYEHLLRSFGEGRLGLAYFGGVTFVKAGSRYDAVPLVLRNVDTRFTSVLVVSGTESRTLEDLRGKRFSFGARLSTSGHLMPRYFLKAQRGVIPEEYFRSVGYSGKHDRTAYWVRDGDIDAGVVNSEIVRRMLADGRLRPGDIRIIWTTPPYTDYVWAVHPEVVPAVRDRIQQAFLRLTQDDPQHEFILSRLGAESFYPASSDDFAMLKQVMESLGML